MGGFMPSVRRALNWLPPQMRLYVFYTISHRTPPHLNREIRCEQCGSYENIEIHHTKYYPEEKVYIDDLQLLCQKCHRSPAGEHINSAVKTFFSNGKRYCLVPPNWIFEY